VKPTSIFGPEALGFAAALALSFIAPLAIAQEGSPPPAGEPSNPWQSPAPAEPAPAPQPSDGAPESSQGSEAASDAPPEKPAPVVADTAVQTSVTTGPQPKQADEAAPEPDDGKLRYHQDHWVGYLGFRVAKISSEGFDPFADSDELAQFSVGLGRTVLTAGNFSLAGLFLYDIGGRSNEARGAKTELTVHRFTVGAEGRYHFIRQLFVFGRVAPGAIHSIAQLEDVSTSVVNQSARNWVFATDLSAGAMFELTGFAKTGNKRRPNLWITLEGGYGFAAASELSMTPDGDAGPERAEPVELGSLGLSGPFMRSAFVLTY